MEGQSALEGGVYNGARSHGPRVYYYYEGGAPRARSSQRAAGAGARGRRPPPRASKPKIVVEGAQRGPPCSHARSCSRRSATRRSDLLWIAFSHSPPRPFSDIPQMWSRRAPTASRTRVASRSRLRPPRQTSPRALWPRRRQSRRRRRTLLLRHRRLGSSARGRGRGLGLGRVRDGAGLGQKTRGAGTRRRRRAQAPRRLTSCPPRTTARRRLLGLRPARRRRLRSRAGGK